MNSKEKNLVIENVLPFIAEYSSDSPENIQTSYSEFKSDLNTFWSEYDIEETNLKPEDFVAVIFEGFDYSVESILLESDTAVVQVNITCKNFSDTSELFNSFLGSTLNVQTLLSLYFSNPTSMLLDLTKDAISSGIDWSDEEEIEKFILVHILPQVVQKVYDTLDAVAPSSYESVSLIYTKENKSWNLSEESIQTLIDLFGIGFLIDGITQYSPALA
jgi:hypothetical protein